MKQYKAILMTGIVILAAILFASSAFVVREGRQAIITQFGRPIGRPITEAGLHFRIPLIQEARFVDKRILVWDGDPEQIPTKDKKFIMVDTTARWKIVDALKFIQTVEDERGARNRLDTILDGVTRDTISSYNLVEAVRNSNSILDKIKEIQEKAQLLKQSNKEKASKDQLISEQEEVFGEIEAISQGREKLSQVIVAKADSELKDLGIQLIDLQLRRIAYEESVEQKVFERMISERKRFAEKIRSIGKGEQAKIRGKIDLDLKRIQSKAYRKSQAIKGKAEAKSVKIYAQAFSKNPSFFEFLRTLEAYDKSLKNDADLILSTDSEFLKYLRQVR